MSQFAFLVVVGSIAGLFALNGGAPAAAQYSSPAVAQYTTADARSLRWVAVEQTRAVIEPYLAALTAREDIAPFLADDVVLSLVEVGQEIHGRDAVAGAIEELHQVAFDANPKIVNLVVGKRTAAVEAIFAGTHTGEFAGIAATGREVRVPYTVFYDVNDGQITALRIQGFFSGLVAQLTAEATLAP